MWEPCNLCSRTGSKLRQIRDRSKSSLLSDPARNTFTKMYREDACVKSQRTRRMQELRVALIYQLQPSRGWHSCGYTEYTRLDLPSGKDLFWRCICFNFSEVQSIALDLLVSAPMSLIAVLIRARMEFSSLIALKPWKISLRKKAPSKTFYYCVWLWLSMISQVNTWSNKLCQALK